MSNYTTEVRFICEEAAGLKSSAGYNDINDIVKLAAPKIFGDFPLFDENYRNILETKILKHYYLREISEETAGLWKFRLNTKMNEIMPLYNKLYESETFKYNPLYDTDYTRTGNRDTDEKANENSEGTSTATDKMTGTVNDEGNRTENRTKSMTESAESEQSLTNSVTDTGSATKQLNSTETGTGETTGHVEEEGSTTENGTLSDDGATSNTQRLGGSDTTAVTKADKNNRWDYFSDTPQGSIGAVPGGGQQALEGNTYLTNVRHITDDGTGSTQNTTQTYGKTVSDTGTSTLDRSTSSTTSTESERNSTENTETEVTKAQTETDTTRNTSNQTQSTTREDGKTGSETGRDVEDTTNTRTYNTTNKHDGKTTGIAQRVLNNTQEYAEHVIGKMGGMTYSRMIQEYRDTLLNIDMMIINDLKLLFFGLWE